MIFTLRCCGPKLSSCGIVLSIWGILQLIIMGLAFQGHNVAFIEDIPMVEKHDEIHPNAEEFYEELTRASKISENNCWVAAGLYGITLAISLHQYWVNSRVTTARYQRQL